MEQKKRKGKIIVTKVEGLLQCFKMVFILSLDSWMCSRNNYLKEGC